MADFLYIFLGLLLSFHICIGAYDEYCPPSAIIAPCDCDIEGINCMKAKTNAELQRVFSSIPRPWKFRGVWIQITDITEIPSFMFRGIEVQGFHIEINRIHTVRPNAFNGSEESARSISLFGNDLLDFPFGELIRFKFLGVINLGRNKLTRIPEKAFYGMKFLREIILPENKINYLEPNAFQNCPSLQKIDLLHNNLNILPPYSFALSAHHPQLMINLANNSIANISPLAFVDVKPKQIHLALNKLQMLPQATFVPLIQRMGPIGGIIDVTYNPFICQGCEFMWLIVNRDVLKFAFQGFRCTDGRSILDLTRSNIWCFN